MYVHKDKTIQTVTEGMPMDDEFEYESCYQMRKMDLIRIFLQILRVERWYKNAYLKEVILGFKNFDAMKWLARK